LLTTLPVFGFREGLQRIRWKFARLQIDTGEKRRIAELRAAGLPYLVRAISAARVRRERRK
jgi:hypothetical protein